MSRAMQDAIARLAALPDAAQDEIAPRLNDYLTRLEELRGLIQEGVDSGSGRPTDELFARLEAKYSRGQSGHEGANAA